MEPQLTQEQQKALDEGHGFVQGTHVVMMTVDVFRRTMGVATDEEMTASLQAIDEAAAELEAGKGIPLDQFKKQLDEKYGVQG